MSTDRSTLAAVAELSGRWDADSVSNDAEPLTRFERRAFSQNGEDGVILEILRRIESREGFFVEFGIDGGHEGNCVLLADVLGWRGLFIEADPEAHASLERKYRAIDRVETVRAAVTPATVEGLFEAADVPREPDVVSIDIDGNDLWVWEALNRFEPRLVIVEYNSALDPRGRLVQPCEPERGWDGTDSFGASLGALEALAARKGYRLVHTELTGVNAFFVREDLAASFPAADRVPRRGVNIFLTGFSHPRGDHGRLVEFSAD